MALTISGQRRNMGGIGREDGRRRLAKTLLQGMRQGGCGESPNALEDRKFHQAVSRATFRAESLKGLWDDTEAMVVIRCIS